MIRPHYADPHFPLLCADLAEGRFCCDLCHDVDDDLPYAMFQDDLGQVHAALRTPGSIPTEAHELGYSCCNAARAVLGAVMATIAGHVAEFKDGCPQCELSETLT